MLKLIVIIRRACWRRLTVSVMVSLWMPVSPWMSPGNVNSGKFWRLYELWFLFEGLSQGPDLNWFCASGEVLSLMSAQTFSTIFRRGWSSCWAVTDASNFNPHIIHVQAFSLNPDSCAGMGHVQNKACNYVRVASSVTKSKSWLPSFKKYTVPGHALLKWRHQIRKIILAPPQPERLIFKFLWFQPKPGFFF